MKTEAAVLYEIGKPCPYAESRPLVVEELYLDGPGPLEVLVEIVGAGLCHSDLSAINGVRPRPTPLVLGHEASGVVREIGSGVEDLRVDDHVVFSYVPMCGRCLFCATGRPALCEKGGAANVAGTLLSGHRRFKNVDEGLLNHHLGVSAFSRFTVAAQESLVKVDPTVSLETAALFGCAVMTGVGAVLNTAQVKPGTSVVVFGLGGVGLSAVLGGRAVGAYPLIAVDVLDQKLQLAKRLGATHVVNSLEASPVEEIREITGGGAACALDAVGDEKVLMDAYSATGRGGKTVAIGIPHPSKHLSVPVVGIVGEERTILGSYMGSCVPVRDIPRFLDLYQAGILPVDLLLSRKIRLDEINSAFDALERGEVVRQVVTFED